jgi:hypothetical protein
MRKKRIAVRATSHTHLYDERHVALLLARDGAVQHERHAADERLRDSARPRLGDDHVRRAHPLLHVAHEAIHHHAQAPRRGAQLVRQRGVAAAHDDDVRVGRQARIQRRSGVFESAHAFSAADEEDDRAVGREAEALAQRAARRQRRSEGGADGETVHDNLAQRKPRVQRLRRHVLSRHKARVHARVEPRGVACRQVSHHRRERRRRHARGRMPPTQHAQLRMRSTHQRACPHTHGNTHKHHTNLPARTGTCCMSGCTDTTRSGAKSSNAEANALATSAPYAANMGL